MPRKLTNWLEGFKQWTMPRSVAPENALTIAGLFTLACVLKRRVKIPDIDDDGMPVLGGYVCPPHLYVTFIAPPGVVTKSTTIGYVETLLDAMPSVNKCPDAITTPRLLKFLSETDDASAYMLADEFGYLIDKSGDTIYSTLIKLFDGKKKIVEATMARDIVFSTNPSFNIISGTTPQWISENMNENILNGGIGSRTLFIVEFEPRQDNLLYHRLTKTVDFNKIQKDLVDDLFHISDNVAGNFKFESLDVMDWVNTEWYPAMKKEGKRMIKLSGYIQRKAQYLFKLAMLLHISYSDDLVITKKDLMEADVLLRRFEVNMPEAFRRVGKNKYVADIDSMTAYVKEKSGVKESELLAQFSPAAEPAMLNSLLAAMIQMDFVTRDVIDKEAWIFPFKKT